MAQTQTQTQIEPNSKLVFFEYVYVIRRKSNVSTCEAECWKETEKKEINIPETFKEYKVIGYDAGDGTVDRGIGYSRESWDEYYLLERNGKKYVASVYGLRTWVTYSNAIECKDDYFGLRLVQACETGRGTVTMTVDIYPIEELAKEPDRSVKEIEEWFESSEDGETLYEALKDLVEYELEREEEEG